MNILLQIALIFGICLLSQWISYILPFTFPGNVISMIILFLLLFSGLLKLKHINEVGEFLRKNMAFFFVPAGVELMGKIDLLKGNIISLILICVISTILTFATTAFTVRAVSKLQKKLKKAAK